ncbi:DUF4397 domain-containing protein [Romboutsia sedimentorum]|uniref:DUF4397 domain-containing protein n=1 Tax=Romboutsia sedimentorum TaxID=1368474 RepID=UPI0024DEFF95|nr:DUF4397 domain-containing protein [Romboutsia sedimentorum]MDK2584387.1 DUF4397 domain-containing protein [Romboutsia sedimentorum]
MDCFNIEKDSSFVRIFHAAPNAPGVDIYVDDSLLFSNIRFQDFTSYVPLEKGEYKVDVYPTNSKEKPVISQMLEIKGGNMFTIAATGNIDDLSLLVIGDYISKETSDDYSTFRAIHLSPEAPAVDVLVDGETLFKDIKFRQGTSYVDVKPDQYKIKIALTSNGEVVLPFKVNLKPNRIYTIYVVGNLDDLSAIQSVDGNTYICK